MRNLQVLKIKEMLSQAGLWIVYADPICAAITTWRITGLWREFRRSSTLLWNWVTGTAYSLVVRIQEYKI